MKFHKPDCGSAKDISEQNRVEFFSRQEAAAQGYLALEGGCCQKEVIVPVELVTAENVSHYGTDGWQ